MLNFNLFGRSDKSPKSGSGTATHSTFERPDFSFPQDVRTDASKVFAEAMKSANAERAMQAAMQLAVADRITSSDSIAETLRRYAEVESRFDAPWSNLAALLRAKTLSAEYTEDKWDFDHRVLPLEEIDSNPQLWSGAQFRLQISDLCEKALHDFNLLAKTDLSTVDGVLSGLKKGNPARFSVADFIVDQVCSIYNESGISDSDGQSAETIAPRFIIDRLIVADEANLTPEEIASGGTVALFQARLQKLNVFANGIVETEENDSPLESLTNGYASQLLKIYPDGNPMRARHVCALYDRGQFNTSDIDNKRQLYALVNSVLARDAGECKTYLEYIAGTLMTPYFSLRTLYQWLPEGNTVSLTVQNVSDGNLLMVPIAAAQAESDRKENRSLKAAGDIRVLQHIALDPSQPSEKSYDIRVENLAPGYYALVMSATKDLSGIYSEIRSWSPEIVLVSTLSCFTSDDPHRQAEDASRVNPKYLYVVDGRDNVPVKGAEVTFHNTQYNRRGEKQTLRTDADGRVALPYEQCRAVITHNGERLLWNGGKSYARREQKSSLQAAVFTDLAIYHPGDTVQLAVVVTESDGRYVKVAPERRLEITLLDANGEEAARALDKTDLYGRVATSVAIPAEGLTGRFRIQVRESAERNVIGYGGVEVADYKAPTFRVLLDSPSVEGMSVPGSEGDDGETVAGVTSVESREIKLSGSVMTYSGVPLADAKIELKVSFQPWWGWWMRTAPQQNEFGARATTDANGRYQAVVDLPDADADLYRYGRFYATATATSPAGETQTSDRQTFAVGEGYTLNPGNPDEMMIDAEAVKINAAVENMLGEKVRKELKYTVAQLDYAGEKVKSIVAEGSFTSPTLEIPASRLPSGVYRIHIKLPEAVKVKKGQEYVWQADSADFNITFWRADDKRPPVATPLWVPEMTCYALPGQKTVEVTVGAGYPGQWIYMETDGRDGVTGREWLRPQGENLKVKVPAPADGEAVRLKCVGEHSLDQQQATVAIYPPAKSRKTDFRVDTFRDRLTPGRQESWRFRLMSGWDTAADAPASAAMRPLGEAAVMAVMSNEALDALVPFRWQFFPELRLDYTTLGDVDVPYRRDVFGSGALDRFKGVRNPIYFESPSFIYLDQFGRRVMYRSMMMKSAAVARPAGAVEDYDGAVMSDAATVANMMIEEAEDELVLEESAVTGTASAEGGQSEVKKEMEMRDMEMPLAFFRPLLNTDADGNVDVTFTVPNFNTTWAFQILGYDKDANAATARMTAVAAKPVMVQTHTPRFLRTGDRAQISATMFNASDEPLSLGGYIEIFDVLSGKVLAREDMAATTVEANASKVVTVAYAVPADMSQVGVRSVVESEKGSDGEQGVVQVLPSSTPVLDATTFYLTPGQREFSLTLPKMKDGNVTLNYCDNPYWYVLTALSGALKPDSDSALDQVVALYSTVVASGLLDRNPALREGIRLALSDDTESTSLTLSPLSKNQSLKIAALNTTPWVNNAASETMRMTGLDFLLEKSSTDKAVADAVSALDKNRSADGAWSWMKGMPSSLWITEQVLDALGRMRASGYMPTDREQCRRLEEMIANGVKYADAEESKYFREVVKRDKAVFPLTSALSYLYTRSNVTSDAPSGLIAEMQRDMLRRLPKEWKGLDLRYKAIAAIMLKRADQTDFARTILESVRQFASYKPDKGMWFDRAADDWFSPSPLFLTAQCLDAYLEVKPDNAAVEKLSQYLVLSRQTTDWNLELGQAGVACVVNSVVSSIRDSWVDAAHDAEAKIRLNGKELVAPRTERLTGNFYLNLDAAEASGAELRIERSGNGPAWGGVLNQYVAPIRDVKAHDVPQLKIAKALLPVSGEADGVKASKSTLRFAKGDRVRVTLTVETDRDLDYLLISDALGAWMQPADQLTEYRIQDGLWMLTETRTAKKNFYITRMPKGKYVLHYEVNADRDGEYSTGIAEAQSQYYPMITAHSAGAVVEVK